MDESEYVCAMRHCYWGDYVEGEDWGYYSIPNNDCASCQDKCTSDPNCAGVECGGRFDCSWWKKGTCVIKGRQRSRDKLDGERITCIKSDQYKDVECEVDKDCGKTGWCHEQKCGKYIF